MVQSTVFFARREKLRELVKQQYASTKHGLIVIAGHAESKIYSFRQESSFYYFTGCNEPGAFLTIDFEGQTTLFVPHFVSDRSVWVSSMVLADAQTAAAYHVDAVRYCGEPWSGYHASLLFSQKQVAHLSDTIIRALKQGAHIFTLNSTNAHEYVESKIIMQRLDAYSPFLADSVDISSIVARMRRIKSREEVELLYKAIEITMIAQGAAASVIAPGVSEGSVKAGIEFIFTESQAKKAFSTIVGSGPHSTVLHYEEHGRTMLAGDVVVIDCGAEVGHYCADITRTYPVSGVFSARQKEVYQLVLDVQQYSAELAVPGMWLNNKDHQDKSLYHCAKAYCARYGYEEYFKHGIGHYLGLDVHDVGSYLHPLEEGDIITIEPGLYISAEKIGVRIEDDYWITNKGAVCLSEELPKTVQDIEAMMQMAQEDKV